MKTLVAIPCMDMVHTPFFRSVIGMRCPEGEEVEISLACSSLVYDSRNLLAKKAVTNGFDRVLWLDSDMEFSGDLFRRLSDDLDGRHYVSGLYMTRKKPIKPVVYKDVGLRQDGEQYTPYADSYIDYPRDSIFEVAASGFGAVMMTTEIIKAVAEKFGLPFAPINGFGEDLSFCLRCSELGYKMYCDSRVKLGHIGFRAFTEETFLQGEDK